MSTSPSAAMPDKPTGAFRQACRFRGADRVEQRRARRHPMSAQVNVEYLQHCQQMHKGKVAMRFWVATRDISALGISFFHVHAMYSGERIRIELCVDGGGFRYVEASIVRCRPTRDGRFEVGAAFQTCDSLPMPEAPEPDAADGADL